MEIPEIKQRLSILQVLNRYGIKPDKNNRLNCPFHEDKTPSMQVYPETNTVFCFSGNCKLNGKAIDVIDFIMHKESCSKHVAILKAKELISPAYSASNTKPVSSNNTEEISRIAVLTKLIYDTKDSLSRSKKAQEYCKQRGLNPESLEAGYLAETYHRSWNEKLKESAIEIGILKKNSNGTYSPNIKGCIVFPMKNKAGKIVDIYGRSIASTGKSVAPTGDKTASINNTHAKHFYLKGKHRGIYPHYPEPALTKLIITESIIDAATLQQLKVESKKLKEYEILALYGTNGLTDEIQEAIKEWILSPLGEMSEGQRGKEIIFMLDGDEAGRKATEKYSEILGSSCKDVASNVSTIETPEGEDINSLLQTYPDNYPEVIEELINNRKVISDKKSELANNKSEPAIVKPIHESAQPPLNTSNPDKIIYAREPLRIEVWGGVEYHNMHRLRLSLNMETTAGRSFRDDVNLYSNRSSKAFIQDASEELEIPQSELKQIINEFIKQIEEYRLIQKELHSNKHKKQVVKLSFEEQKEALKILNNKNLVSEIKRAMQKVGLIGETDNGLLLFLIFLTRNFDTPLHALVHGSSGSGKTNLLKSILKLVPEESKYETTALTENVLFRPPYKDFWKNKILLIEDLDGSYKALLPLREFMSNQYISKLANDPNPKTGRYEQVTLEASGPIVIAGATTKDRVYEDNSNRSFLLHVNESKAHEEKVLDYQNREAAGLTDKDGIRYAAKQIQDIQRMLNPEIRVINPFQPQLKLPEYVFSKKRTNTHYITLIKSITFLFQHQRETKKDDKGKAYIETTLEDVALANQLSKESLLRKSDELSGQLREFFEVLKAQVKETGKESFVSKEIRSKLRMHPMKFNRYVNELKNRAYIKQEGGNRKLGYEYVITVWDDYQVLKQGLTVMDEILNKLWEKYPDGRYIKSVKN